MNSTGAANGIAKVVDVKGFANLSGTESKPLVPGFDGVITEDVSSRWNAWLGEAIPSFEPIPFEKIGLFRDEYRRALPVR